VALAIENSYLHQRVQDVAVLQERERIAREMHDGLGQVLGYINTQTLAVKKLLSNDRIGDATTELTSMEENARSLYADVREGILGLRTSPHANGGLFPGLDEYVGRYGEMSGIDATLHVAANAEGCHIRPSIETQLMRIVQEALSNVRKHAKATSVSVGFTRCENILEIEVTDDGQGFDPAGVRSSGWPRFGLQTMRERAESVGGSFAVTSAPGQGASIVVRVPLGIKQEARG
jgi:signal transduction histidine kinase